ncbi:hypothetical protein [Pseudarthrobacter phenanthrenivorans]|nr:hypothetical protein [Pseudarthrobacter phenanthrenivorans]
MVGQRLELLGEDETLLDELQTLYSARHGKRKDGWFPESDQLGDEHALFAAWMLALGDGSSDDFAQDVLSATNRSLAEFKQPGLCNRPAIWGWSFGHTNPNSYDQRLPVVFANDLGDRDVSLAYKGLVEHLSHRGPESDWHEMDFTSVIIRCAGLAEGAMPEGESLRNSIDKLMIQSSRLIPHLVKMRLLRQWGDFVIRRNAIAHVRSTDGRSFSTEVPDLLSADEIKDYLTGITYFMAQVCRRDLEDPERLLGRDGMLRQIRAELEFCL